MFDDIDWFTAILWLAALVAFGLVGWWVVSMLMSFHAEANALLQSAGATH